MWFSSVPARISSFLKYIVKKIGLRATYRRVKNSPVGSRPKEERIQRRLPAKTEVPVKKPNVPAKTEVPVKKPVVPVKTEVPVKKTGVGYSRIRRIPRESARDSARNPQPVQHDFTKKVRKNFGGVKSSKDPRKSQVRLEADRNPVTEYPKISEPDQDRIDESRSVPTVTETPR